MASSASVCIFGCKDVRAGEKGAQLPWHPLVLSGQGSISTLIYLYIGSTYPGTFVYLYLPTYSAT